MSLEAQVGPRRPPQSLVRLGLEGGCLDPDHPTAPRYELNDRDRDEIVAGIDVAKNASGPPAPIDDVARRLDRLGCLRCHASDGSGGIGEELDLFFVSEEQDTDLGDEGRLPPDLSDVGFKLTTPWLREVLTGDGRSRPYLAARMPHYGEAVEGLAEGMARRLGIVPHTDAREPEVSHESAMLGRGLMDRTKLSCVACHVYKDFPPNGTVGADITRFGERVRYEWFASFLQNPMRYRAGTRMPSFTGQGGKSTLTTILDGDLHGQIDALWAYFTLGEFMPPPEGVEPARGMPLAIGTRPRVFRSFLKNAGSRGIAVGFPAGVHFGFDAERVRLVEVWGGEFLDASGAWAGRGGNVSGGTGNLLWEAPKGSPLFFPTADEEIAAETEPSELGFRFDGYRLEPDGHPVFLYSLNDIHVEERWMPRLVPTPGFSRAFLLSGDVHDQNVVVRGGKGASELIDAEGVTLVASGEADGQVLHVLKTAAEGPVSFRLEVTP